MKLFFSLLFVAMSVCGTMAQTDSVRIKLQTSPGAEIGIDGDQSSTNQMTVKVATGTHRVTVTYGMSFKRDFNITVSQTEREFTFPVEGKILVDSNPAGTVYIDGLSKGRTPLTLGLLGDHNLRIEGSDGYYDYTERISVPPMESISRDVALAKCPPPGNLILTINTPLPDLNSIGITLAYGKRWGIYLRGMIPLNEMFSVDGENERYPLALYENKETGLLSVTGGLLYCVVPNIYVYAGGGWGRYSHTLENQETNRLGDRICLGSEGIAADIGIIGKLGNFLIQGGWSTIMGENNPSAYKGFYVGLGYSLEFRRK